jgi:hypothetical protein
MVMALGAFLPFVCIRAMAGETVFGKDGPDVQVVTDVFRFGPCLHILFFAAIAGRQAPAGQ